jgi:hypothetical protein
MDPSSAEVAWSMRFLEPVHENEEKGEEEEDVG